MTERLHVEQAARSRSAHIAIVRAALLPHVAGSFTAGRLAELAVDALGADGVVFARLHRSQADDEVQP